MYSSTSETSERLSDLIATQKALINEYRAASGLHTTLELDEVSALLHPNFKYWASTLIRRRHFERHSLEGPMDAEAEQAKYEQILRSIGFAAEATTVDYSSQAHEQAFVPVDECGLSGIVSANVTFVYRTAQDAPHETRIDTPMVEVA